MYGFGIRVLQCFVWIGLVILMAACGAPYAARPANTYQVYAEEARKLSSVRTGSSEVEVRGIMGDTALIVFSGEDYESESRPYRQISRTLANGWLATVLFYRVRVVHHDGICTDDETDAVVLLDGKVDTVVRGDRVEAFLDKFRK